jgi:hypothetical protein
MRRLRSSLGSEVKFNQSLATESKDREDEEPTEEAPE